MWQNLLPERAESVPTDSLARALEAIFARPEYRWSEARNPLITVLNWLRSLAGKLDLLREAHPVAYFALLTVLLLILGAILLHAIYLLQRTLDAAAEKSAPDERLERRKKDVTYHLDRAKLLSEQGRLAEALGHRFTALLLELERRNLLEFDMSTTPAEYLDRARLPAGQQAQLHWLVRTLYKHMFGHVTCRPDDFREFGERADRLVAEVAH